METHHDNSDDHHNSGPRCSDSGRGSLPQAAGGDWRDDIEFVELPPLPDTYVPRAVRRILSDSISHTNPD
jgi:hypothetical protein